MRRNFWLRAWEEGNIGFHRDGYHPALEECWPAVEAGRSVLVPLCGKSRDLLWLEERGLEVTGIEFVESAVQDFFRESGLAWDRDRHHGCECYRARERRIRIFVADLVHFASAYDGPRMDSLYDRAALVALPPDMRKAYVAACRKLLSGPPRGLLVSLEYEPECMEGPPFSVASTEVERLWRGSLAPVRKVDMLSSMPRAVDAGVRRLHEVYWVLR